ncbi:hypothetical protein KAR91_04260 [Candidatus Pacearchaeota archaeon]|nr:hypothetical protein [Candidatus Pacearchaeota archaeon]
MAVVDVKESWEGLEADLGREAASAQRQFTVQFDTDDDPLARPFLAVEAAVGDVRIPNIWERHPIKNWLFVRNKTPRRLGPLLFEVTVAYTTISYVGRDQNLDPTTDPLSQPWEIEWGFAMSNEPIDRDIFSRAITNSAGEPFDPPITRDFADLVLRIRRNEAAFSPGRAYLYKDTVNSDWVWGFAPGCVRCVDYSGRIARAADMFYWQVNYEFQIRRDGWRLIVFDAGYREINGDGTDYENITDEDGNQVAQPWPLNGAGRKLTLTEIQNRYAYFRTFDIYRAIPYTLLGL